MKTRQLSNHFKQNLFTKNNVAESLSKEPNAILAFQYDHDDYDVSATYRCREHAYLFCLIKQLARLKENISYLCVANYNRSYFYAELHDILFPTSSMPPLPKKGVEFIDACEVKNKVEPDNVDLNNLREYTTRVTVQFDVSKSEVEIALSKVIALNPYSNKIELNKKTLEDSLSFLNNHMVAVNYDFKNHLNNSWERYERIEVGPKLENRFSQGENKLASC